MAKELHRVGGNEDLIVAHDGNGRPQLFRNGELDMMDELPFRDYPGIPLPPDPIRDKTILENLRMVGDGRLPKKHQVLNYPQSRALFEGAHQYFANEMPLMNTERWLAAYVQNNDLTYTDHDGRRYKMKNGKRYPVSAAKPIEEPEEDFSEEDTRVPDGFEDLILV